MDVGPTKFVQMMVLGGPLHQGQICYLMHLNGTFFFLKDDILKIVEAKDIIIKIDLLAKVAHIGAPSIYQNIVFSETIRPIELKFHMKTPYDKLAKIIQFVLVT